MASAALLSLALLAGCDDGDDGAPGASGTAGSNGLSTLLALGSEPIGANCPAGGTRISSGLDANRSGVLDVGEISGTQFVCGGAAAVARLVVSSPEPAGSNCASAGSRIDSGIDANTDGSLQPSEISNTNYACNGAPGVTGAAGATGATGPAGATGTAGIQTLVRTTALAVSSTSCPAGGLRIEAGADADRNGLLADAEISSSATVCSGTNGTNGTNGAPGAPGTNGTNGLNSLIVQSVEPTGVNCANGGARIQSGVDANGNASLEVGEVNATSYVCTPPPSTSWVGVSADTPMVRNTGYVVDSASNVTLTLPATASLTVGDRVAVSGAGGGRWTLAQNAGQRVSVKNLQGAPTGVVWIERESGRNWTAVASSVDGSKLVAVDQAGQIYTSTDSGVNWTARETTRAWDDVTSSADGSKLVAVVGSGQIYTSTDSGVSWTARESNRAWRDVASSANGSKLVAVDRGGRIYTSTNSGVSWTARESNRLWSAVASSDDGDKLVAVEQTGQIYTSTDSGVSWTARETNRNWVSVASSAEGSKLVAAVETGQIYTSTDSGVSWTARASTQDWVNVVSSADGSKLAAASIGQIYISADSGVTWTARETPRGWSGVASSADGKKLVAVNSSGRIHTSDLVTTEGTGGLLRGGQFDTLELQYLGGGMFAPLSSIGAITYQ